MGVVYKLTDEIIDFIVQQKHERPKISCRKLADLTSKTFDIVVSKSSVNTILKNSALSSPVGRRAGESVPQKERAKETKPRAVPQMTEQPKAAPLPKPIAPPPKPKPRQARLDITKSSNLRPKTEPPRAPSPAPSPEKILYDGMGSIFLKAAQWDLSPRPLLGELLKEHIRGFALKDLYALSDILIFLQAFGVERVQDLEHYKGQGLWEINGLSHRLDYHVVEEMVRNIDNFPGFAIKVANEIPQILSEVSYVELILEDDESFFIDTQLNTLWDKNVQSTVAAPHYKLLSNLSRKIIHNLEPLIICSAPGQTGLTPELNLLIDSFGGRGGRSLKKVALYDEGGAEIAQFTTLPQKRRHFILGIWPWHSEFEPIQRSAAGSSKKYIRDAFHPQITFCELPGTVLGEVYQALRVFVLYDGDNPEPSLALLSNFDRDEMSAEGIVYSYLMRWPDLRREHNTFITEGLEPLSAALNESFVQSPQPAFIQGIDQLEGNIQALFLVLNNYCQRHYLCGGFEKFDVTQLKSILYSLPGTIQRSGHFLNIQLVLPQTGYNYQDALKQSILRFNESDVCDWEGRKVFITV